MTFPYAGSGDSDAVDPAEIDVLDALLNEMARANGGRDTEASRLHDAHDGSELLSSARVFHRRFGGTSQAGAAAHGLDPHLWERIMANSSPSSSVSGYGATSIPASRQVPVRASRRPERWSPPPVWQVVSNIALIALLLVAGFGAWRVYEGLNATGPGESVPGFASQPATPESVVAEDDADEAFVVEPAFDCDFSRDIPIFRQVNETPFEGTALLVTTSNELVLTCPEEPEPIVLATDVEAAGAAGWPGVVRTSSGGASAGDLRESVVNVVTGEQVAFGYELMGIAFGASEHVYSPFFVTRFADRPDEWAVIDFRTMEIRALSDIAGAEFPGDQPIQLSEAGGAPVIAIASLAPFDPSDPGAGTIVNLANTPGDILIIDGSLDNARWISLPEDVAGVREMMLSPDGSSIAVKRAAGDGNSMFDSTAEVVVLDTAGGTEMGRSGTFDQGLEITYFAAWVQDGAMFVWVQDGALMGLAVDGDGAPVEIAEVGEGTGHLRTTYDPDVVTVLAGRSTGTIQTLIVNTRTGETITRGGSDARDSYGWPLPPSRHLVLHSASEPYVFRAYDAATGVAVADLDSDIVAAERGYHDIGRRGLAVSDDGGTLAIGFDASMIYVQREIESGPQFLLIQGPKSPAGVLSGDVSLILSPDGSMLSLVVNGDESRTGWLLDIDAVTYPEDEWTMDTWPEMGWIAVTPQGVGANPSFVLFVPGIGD